MIAIIDYQMGNLRSVQKALERVGAEAVITSDSREILKADKVVLPGVGAFGDCIAELHRRDLAAPLKDFIASDRPFLGICLGLQVLFETGYEGGTHRGLGVLPGEVVRFDLPDGVKVPHMGWNQLQFTQPSPLFEGLDGEVFVYFVHSYFVVPEDKSVIASQTYYTAPFCSSIRRGNLYATQFHPEKSQTQGLRILKNFAEL